jgi:transposase
MDIHWTFAEMVFWEDGRLRWHGRVDMTRSGLEGFARSLTRDDEVVVEATGNAMAVVRVLSPYVASLPAAGFLPEVWVPDAETERRCRLVARRN